MTHGFTQTALRVKFAEHSYRFALLYATNALGYAILCLVLLLIAFTAQAQKQLVVTIDDLPTVSMYYGTPQGRLLMTQKLLAHCTAYRVPAIGFVVSSFLQTNANKPDSNQVNLLGLWLDAGLELGNHTFAHKDYNLVAFNELKDDVIAGESIVREFVEKRGKPFRYFRHPYLRKGNTQAKKDSLEAFLQRRGYQEAPVTIDNYDWQFSRAYDNALLLGDTALATQVGRRYLTYMSNYVTYYEAQSDSLFGRQIPQIILLHANAINAGFLSQLFILLKQRGYQFVSLETALKDEAYRSADRYYGKGGISWMHRWALTKGETGAFFRGEPEVPTDVVELANRKR